ncbi:hypothetical protein HD554DRAFT_2328636 [Boletus coccyginus]|nr:hypothetical protein HD554DRAFT_2328636 [Boletus coccyginus]
MTQVRDHAPRVRLWIYLLWHPLPTRTTRKPRLCLVPPPHPPDVHCLPARVYPCPTCMAVVLVLLSPSQHARPAWPHSTRRAIPPARTAALTDAHMHACTCAPPPIKTCQAATAPVVRLHAYACSLACARPHRPPRIGRAFGRMDVQTLSPVNAPGAVVRLGWSEGTYGTSARRAQLRPTVQKPKQHPPTATCAACRVALRVPSHHQKSAHVLCPPCQARHAAAIGNPRPLDCAWGLRANPYPVVTPITESTHTVASTVAYTYLRVPAPSPALLLQSVGAVNAGGGVHTSANHAKDAPRACASAGFTRLPRVSRHVTDCNPRPLESHDLPGTSLMREAVRGATVTTEREAVEDEMEVDLVYPDVRPFTTSSPHLFACSCSLEDIPVATRCASTSSEAKNVEFKPIEDEDAEPELVYPEDVAEATQASSSTMRTKSSVLTTLHALFTDGLRIIHGLQDLTTLVDKSPEVSVVVN